MNEGIDKLMEDDNDEDLDAFLSGAIQAKFDAELKQELENDLRQDFRLFKKNTGRFRVRRRRFTYYLLAAAAGALLILISLNFFGTSTTSARELATVYLAESDIYHSGTTKGSSSQNETLRQQAINAFNEKKYGAADQYFDQIEEKNEEDYFYKGVALLLDNQSERAIADLEIVANTGSAYATEANWYLAIAQLFIGDHAGAAAALSKIKGSSWNQEKIQSLLQALNTSQ